MSKPDSSEPKLYKDVLKELKLERPTTDDWRKEGVFSTVEVRINKSRRKSKDGNKGQKHLALPPEQYDRLVRFCRYRNSFQLPQPVEIVDLVTLLNDEDDGDFESAREFLEEFAENLEGVLDAVRLEIQRLHAKEHGDDPIDPSDTDLEY